MIKVSKILKNYFKKIIIIELFQYNIYYLRYFVLSLTLA